MRDGHEPNEPDEQRPCCVPIDPVHVISSPKDRREQEGYQNSGSLVKKDTSNNDARITKRTQDSVHFALRYWRDRNTDIRRGERHVRFAPASRRHYWVCLKRKQLTAQAGHSDKRG